MVLSLIFLLALSSLFCSNSLAFTTTSRQHALVLDKKLVSKPRPSSRWALLSTTSAYDEEEQNPTKIQLCSGVVDDRRSVMRKISRRATSTVIATVLGSQSLLQQPKETTAATTTATSFIQGSTNIPTITHRISMDVRISRQDGTFFVRDDLDESIPNNQVRYFTLQFGLFGNDSPKAVEEFLKYVDVTASSPLDDDPLPSYGRSSFAALDQATGLLMAGAIPSLEVTSFSGSAALKYGGRILPAVLWGNYPAMSHNAKGLLTHRNLDVSPQFGITTRPAAAELDGLSSIFGQLMLDDANGLEFLNVVEDLPTYSMERPRGDPRTETALDTVAADVFNAQRDFFRKAAQSVGDTRVSKVYKGKILRRVEATRVSLLQ